MATREQYLEALGIPAYLYDSTRHNTTADKIKTRCLVLESTQQDSFCQPGEAQTLLLKMLGAIHLRAEDVVLRNVDPAQLSSVLSEHETSAVLLMSEQLNPSAKQHFSTYHPSVILANAKLKRDAWEVLKQLELCLK